MRLLLVEDDPELASVLEAGFREQGMQVMQSATMPSGRAEAIRAAFDVIVLDVMLPGGSGIDLCRELRGRGIATPILMLTARDAVDDRVIGLEVGADDYVTKPFAFRELVARVRALARRRPALIPRVVTIANLEVDLASRRVERGGYSIELTAKEFALLEFFVLHRGVMPLMEFDADGNFIRGFGDGLFERPHGLRIDAADNIWTTDVAGHVVYRFNPAGRLEMVLGCKSRPGDPG